MTRPEFSITVNKKPVPVSDSRMTGLEIKQAAIAAGIAIDADFQLQVARGSGEWLVVGDAETVTVNKNSEFRALAPDDNS